MAEGLVDIGGGVKMISPNAFSNQGGGGGAAETLSLMNLQNNLQNAPLERKKLEIDTALRANELMNLDVQNLLQKAQLVKAQGDETRAQTKFQMDVMKGIYELYKVDVNLGEAALSQINPDASTIRNNDGTVDIEFPREETKIVDGEMRTVPLRDKIKISIDPNKLDPEKKREIEGQWYDRFQKNPSIQKYRDISPQFKNIKEQLARATAGGDISGLFLFFKILDPNSTVREGEQAQLKQAGNIPAQFINLYNRALSTNAPVFGDENSPLRKDFVKTVEILKDNSRQDAIMAGRDLVDMSRRSGIDYRNIITPVGDLNEDDFRLTDEDVVNNLKNALVGGKK